MKVIRKHNYKDGKFIFTREVSEFTDYKLPSKGTYYQMSECVKNILEDK